MQVINVKGLVIVPGPLGGLTRGLTDHCTVGYRYREEKSKAKTQSSHRYRLWLTPKPKQKTNKGKAKPSHRYMPWLAPRQRQRHNKGKDRLNHRCKRGVQPNSNYDGNMEFDQYRHPPPKTKLSRRIRQIPSQPAISLTSQLASQPAGQPASPRIVERDPQGQVGPPNPAHSKKGVSKRVAKNSSFQGCVLLMQILTGGVGGLLGEERWLMLQANSSNINKKQASGGANKKQSTLPYVTPTQGSLQPSPGELTHPWGARRSSSISTSSPLPTPAEDPLPITTSSPPLHRLRRETAGRTPFCCE